MPPEMWSEAFAPGPSRWVAEGATLGPCPACGGQVAPDSRAMRFRDAFFHIRCALSSLSSHRSS